MYLKKKIFQNRETSIQMKASQQAFKLFTTMLTRFSCLKRIFASDNTAK
jgi:hypothetical protein